MAVANVPKPKVVSTQYGGFDNGFVETVPGRYVCSTVCTKVLRDPHITSCCGQHVCETCLNYWFEKYREQSCPHCRAKGSDFKHFLDKKLKREISELKIWCSNKDKGCNWRDELQTLEKHIKSSDGCSYVEVECPNFPFISTINKCPKMLRKDLDEHIRNACKFRLVTCIHCNEKQKHFYQLSHHHRCTCTQYPCPCPNKCGTQNIPRKDVRTHRNECPLEAVECPFAEAGCDIKLVRNQLKKHQTDYQQTHLLQLMTDYRKSKEALTATKAALAATKATLAATKATLTETNTTLATLAITNGRLESMQEGISRELQKAKVTRDLEPILKSIQTSLGQNKINKKGIEYGLQFTIPAESYFKDNREWYSPAFYVRYFKVCVLARYILHSGLLEWALVVLGTERDMCEDILQGKIEDSIIEFDLPCASNPSKMYMHNVIKARKNSEIKPKPYPMTLTIFISEMIEYVHCFHCAFGDSALLRTLNSSCFL